MSANRKGGMVSVKQKTCWFNNSKADSGAFSWTGGEATGVTEHLKAFKETSKIQKRRILVLLFRTKVTNMMRLYCTVKSCNKKTFQSAKKKVTHFSRLLKIFRIFVCIVFSPESNFFQKGLLRNVTSTQKNMLFPFV